MEVKAQLNGLRLAPRKVRLLVGLIKKKDVDAALDQVTHLSSRASRPLAKLINSAIANAENNFRMVRSNLYVKNAWVDEGIKLRRWRPKGFGRAAAIQKKTSHINVVLDERVPGMRAAEKPVKEKQEAAPAPQADEASGPAPEKKPVLKRAESAPAKPKGGGLKGFGRRLFRRKSI